MHTLYTGHNLDWIRDNGTIAPPLLSNASLSAHLAGDVNSTGVNEISAATLSLSQLTRTELDWLQARVQLYSGIDSSHSVTTVRIDVSSDAAPGGDAGEAAAAATLTDGAAGTDEAEAEAAATEAGATEAAGTEAAAEAEAATGAASPGTCPMAGTRLTSAHAASIIYWVAGPAEWAAMLFPSAFTPPGSGDSDEAGAVRRMCGGMERLKHNMHKHADEIAKMQVCMGLYAS